MIERARNAFNDGRLLDELIPVPQELRDTVSGHCGDGYAQELNQFKMELNIKYFGAKDWYDFCVNKWGTKWDVGADGNPAQDIPGGLMLGFDSAWSPPLGAYEQMVEMGFRIRAMYYEGGMAFAGIWEDGNDDYYEYGGMNSEQVAKELPPELDEAFGISESMAEWEAENEEDTE
jgi:hypothetical protein